MLTFAEASFGQGIPAASLQDEKVAVIVSTGDTNGPLDNSLHSLEDQAIATYGKLGFRVVLVGGVNKHLSDGSPAVLLEKLRSLRGVTDLRLDFLGHGTLGSEDDVRSLSKAELSPPSIFISSPRREQMSDELRKALGNAQPAWASIDMTNADVAGLGSQAEGTIAAVASPKRPPNLITQDSIQKAVTGFESVNPGAAVTVNLLNCYSGAVAQSLRNEPHAIVFANSPPTEPALDLTSGGPQNAAVPEATSLQAYYERLLDGSASLFDARARANESIRTELSENGMDEAIFSTGRSPVYEAALGWCEQAPAAATATPQPTDAQRAAFSRARAELHEMQTKVAAASNMPGGGNETRKTAFEECLHPPIMAGLGLQGAWDLQPEPRAPDLRAAILNMIDFYLGHFTAAHQEEVASAVKAALKRQAGDLKGVPKDRWGEFGRVYARSESGDLKPEEVVNRLRKTLFELRAACSRNFLAEACKGGAGALKSMDLFLPRHPYVAIKCESLDYECLYKSYGGLEMSTWYVFNQWLDPEYDKKREPAPSTPERKPYCQKKVFAEYERELRNFALDQTCLDRFEKSAPSGEWSNLERIMKLSSRDANGRSAVLGTDRKNDVSSPTTQ